jgi:hypothetical protein
MLGSVEPKFRGSRTRMFTYDRQVLRIWYKRVTPLFGMCQVGKQPHGELVRHLLDRKVIALTTEIVPTRGAGKVQS